jgi:ABC-type uncharacterized transport system auxiliary subunit
MKKKILKRNTRDAFSSTGRFRFGPAKFVGLALVAILGTLMTGCGAARPMRYYQLTVPRDMSAGAPNATGISLALGPLVSSHLYREDRIVYAAGPEEMGTYEFQRWTEPPAEMISEVLLRTLRASGRYRDVYSLRSGSQADFLLRGRLYDFKEVSANGLSARVTLEFQLKDMKTGSTVWSHFYGHDEPVNGKDVPAIVEALDKNVQRAVGEVNSGLEQYFSTATSK